MADVSQMQAKLPSWVQNNKPGGSGGGDTPWLQGFAQSAVESIPELFGFNPSGDTLKWRRENPIAGVTSSLLGSTVPYAGWAGASRKIGVIDDVIRGIGNAEKAPFLTGAVREMARFAPLEAARIGVNAVAGDMPTGEMVGSAALNTALGGALGGAFGTFAAGGPRAKSLTDITPFVKQLDAPYQLQMRDLRQAMAEGRAKSPEEVSRIQAVLNDYSAKVRTETAGMGRSYVNDLRTDGGSSKGVYPEAVRKENIRNLNRLFKPGDDNIQRQMFAVTAAKTGFATVDERKAAQSLFALPEDFDQYTQFPRYITAKNDKAARQVHETFTRSLDSIGHNTWIGREGDEGLAIIAKKVGDPAKPSAADKWVVFKTDTPALFVPEGEKWAKKVIGRTAWMAESRKPPPSDLEIPNVLEKLVNDTPMNNYLAVAAKQGKPAEIVESLITRAGLKNVVGEGAQAVENARGFLREYLAPAMFQFQHSPRANYLWGMSRAAFDFAERRAESILHGDIKLKGNSIWAQIWKQPEYEGGLLSNVDNIFANPKNLEDLTRIWRDQTPLDEVAKMGVSDELYGFLKQLDTVDKREVAQIQGIQKWAGASERFMPTAGHYMLSRTWKGNHRVVVADEAGRPVYMASGHTRRQAIEEADAVVAKAKAEGMEVKALPATLAGRVDDLALAAKIRVNSPTYKTLSSLSQQLRMDEARRPATFKKRIDMKGYTGQEGNLTVDDIREILTANVQQRNKYLAELTVKARLADDYGKLAAENPNTYKQLMQRLDDLSGKPGPLAQIQNQVVDKALGGILGPNSATKIVRTANTLMMNFQLGMGNVAHPILNAMTFFQTTLPHMAFILSATPARLGRYYSEFPFAGSDGTIRGSASALDMFKIMRASFREMGKPDATLNAHFAQAAKEGVWDPRLVEEYVGESKKAVTDLRSALKGPEGFVGWLKAVSEFMPGQSEKFARGHTFVTGHIMGRDLLGLEGDQLYRFAKQFTNNTMYLYGTADRARIMTTPLGSMWGLFKNWQAHYIASMMEYTGEAFFRGNWKPFMWMMGGTSVVGGVAATPLYTIADAASRMLTDKSLMVHAYDQFGRADKGDEFTSDALIYGLPSFLGISLQGSSTLPGADPVRDASMLFSFVHYNRAAALGRAVGTSIDTWSVTGQHPMRDPNVRDQFIQALAPKSLARVASMVGEEGMRSLNTGYPVMDKMSLADKMLYGMGMNPVEVDRRYAANAEMWARQDKVKEQTTTYGRLVANAWDNKDYKRATQLLRNATAEGLDISSVTKSAKARQAKREDDMITRTFSPELRKEYAGVTGLR